MAEAVATRPLRTAEELAGGSAPPVYRPRITAIRVLEGEFATYYRSLVRAAAIALSSLDTGGEEVHVSEKELDELLQMIAPKIQATERKQARLKRALTIATTEIAEAAYIRGTKEVQIAVRRLSGQGKRVQHRWPRVIAKQDALERAKFRADFYVTHMSDIQATAWAKLGGVIRRGIGEGKSIPQIATDLKEIEGLWTEHRPKTQSRAEMIARTETGRAYNMGSLLAYEDSDVVEYVNVYDDEGPNSCEACHDLNGQVWTLDYAKNHLLEHPNCVRSFGPAIQIEDEDIVPDKGREEVGEATPPTEAQKNRSIAEGGEVNWILDGKKQPTTILEMTQTFSQEEAAARKIEICKRIAKRTGYSQDEVNAVLRQWAVTSNGDARALALQQAISEEFGVPLTEWQQKEADNYERQRRELHSRYADGKINAATWVDERKELSGVITGRSPASDRTAVREILRGMYDDTQEEFKAAGIKDVVIYRGLGLDQDLGYPGAEIPIVANPGSSWSPVRVIADNWARRGNQDYSYVIEARVPVSRVFCTAKTGMGCSSEMEFILLGPTEGQVDKVRLSRVWEQGVERIGPAPKKVGLWERQPWLIELGSGGTAKKTVDEDGRDLIMAKEASAFLHRGLREEKSPYGTKYYIPATEDQKATMAAEDEISEFTDLTNAQVRNAVKIWASTSNDDDLDALTMQKSAAELFDLKFSAFSQRKLKETQAFWRGRGKDPEKRLRLSVGLQKQLLRTMYENTQRQFTEAGFEPGRKIRLYRGVVLSREELPKFGSTIEMSSNTLESWTSRRDIAENFAKMEEGEELGGIVLSMDVPIELVLGTGRTGFGTLRESEFVLLQGRSGHKSRVVELF